MSRFGNNNSRSSNRSSNSSSSPQTGAKKEYAFSSIGSICMSQAMMKTADPEVEDLIEALIEKNVSFNLSFFLPKGTDLTVDNDTRLLVSFKEVEKAPNFVIGRVLIPNK